LRKSASQKISADIFPFFFLLQQTKFLEVMAADGQYPAHALAQAQARLRRMLDELL
jgi:hypothetical protein